MDEKKDDLSVAGNINLLNTDEKRRLSGDLPQDEDVGEGRPVEWKKPMDVPSWPVQAGAVTEGHNDSQPVTSLRRNGSPRSRPHIHNLNKSHDLSDSGSGLTSGLGSGSITRQVPIEEPLPPYKTIEDGIAADDIRAGSSSDEVIHLRRQLSSVQAELDEARLQLAALRLGQRSSRLRSPPPSTFNRNRATRERLRRENSGSSASIPTDRLLPRAVAFAEEVQELEPRSDSEQTDSSKPDEGLTEASFGTRPPSYRTRAPSAARSVLSAGLGQWFPGEDDEELELDSELCTTCQQWRGAGFEFDLGAWRDETAMYHWTAQLLEVRRLLEELGGCLHVTQYEKGLNEFMERTEGGMTMRRSRALTRNDGIPEFLALLERMKHIVLSHSVSRVERDRFVAGVEPKVQELFQEYRHHAIDQ